MRNLIVTLGLLAAAWAIGGQAVAQQSAPTPTRSPVIARVAGRPILQEDFDRIGAPYFARLRAEMKQGYNDQVQRMADYNVLQELIRREVLAVEARRRKIPVSVEETDRFLRQDPFFNPNGHFDQAKFIQYKIDPASNYLTVLPKIRELVAASKLDSLVRRQCRPSVAKVRAEWNQRNELVRFKLLALGPNDVSLEPEASATERAAYYSAHPEEFERKPRLRVRYVRLALPPPDDPGRAAAEDSTMERARGIADSLRAGVALDSLSVELGGSNDTGLIEVPSPIIPGVGRSPEFGAELARADSDTTVRIVGPTITGAMVVVGEVVERQARSVPPMDEVLAEVKRRADAEKRRRAHDAELEAYYRENASTYRTARAQVARVILPDSAIEVRTPSARDVERWFKRNGATLAPAESASAIPPLDDSLRAVVASRIIGEERTRRAARALSKVAGRWSREKDRAKLVRKAKASAETVAFVGPSASDPVFPAAFLDTLLHGEGVELGAVSGPRRFGDRVVLWSVASRDTAYLPPFDAVRREVESGVQERQRQRDEEEARAYFDTHRDEFKTPPRFVIDYVKVSIPAPDSVAVPEEDVRRAYDENLDRYRQEEQVRARHILIGTRPNQTPGGEPVARARADSLLAAIRSGADFAELARRFSEDPGSATAGGDLGFFPRGRMVQAFSDTAFALPIGRVSEPVKTRFGYHLIETLERKPAGLRSFDEVASQIRFELGRERADSLALREADALRRRLARGGDPAKLAASTGGLITSPPFAENEPVPGLGFVPGLGQEIQSLAPGRWASRAFRAGTGYVIARSARRVPPAPAEFADVLPQAISAVKNEKKRRILEQKQVAIREALAAGASLDSIATLYGGLKDSGVLTRSSGFVPSIGREPRIIARAFELEPGTVSDTLMTAQGVAWIRVEERKSREGASFAKDRAAIEQELENQAYEEWLEKRKAETKIEILRADLREKPQPIQQTFTIGGQESR